MAIVIADRYTLDPVHIGKGGMGEVWGATDRRLRRRVAVKFIRFPDDEPDPDLVRRFVRESQLTARMDHPGVPVIHDAAQVGDGPFQGRLYLVMQLIDGISVDDLVAEHDPLPIGWAAAIAAQTCAVLAYAHGRKLIHRDLKPSNLMLARDGGVKVLDFGLAVALDASERSRITRTNQTVGTLAYMAPEQFRGEVEARSDLYALGCVLYRMLTGELPFDGPTEASVMHGQLYEKPVSIRDLRPDVPAGLEAVALRLLAKQPQDRPASAADAYRLLEPYVTALPELPGAIDQGPNPWHMYAQVVGRIPAAPPDVPRDDAPPASRTGADGAGGHDGIGAGAREEISAGDLVRARRQAERLARESRYGEAAGMLTRVAEEAGTHLGDGHSDVIGVRIDLANILLTGGNYARAAAAFHRLAEDLAHRDGPDTDLVFEFRQQEATCHAALGESDLALDRLRGLLTDQMRVRGRDDDRVTALREQIGLLLHGIGRNDEAVAVLEELAADLERRHGPAAPAVRELHATIRRITRG